MGNVDSQMNSDEYIQQQKEIIEKQQQQIDNLMRHNQPITTEPEPEPVKQKVNPYEVLGISKQYTENELKKAYLQKAMVYHPDRGG